MSRQCTAGKGNMPSRTYQKLEIIRSLENSEYQREVKASYNVGSSAICDMEAPQSFLVSSKSVKFLYK
jgi:hypothetical protein